jgi:hypothetical protein
MLRLLQLFGSIRIQIDGLLHLLPAIILTKYLLTVLKQDESMPVMQEVSNIDAEKNDMLVTILNAKALGMWW